MIFRHPFVTTSTVLALFLTLSNTAVADELLIGVGQQAAEMQQVDRPFKGMDRQSVYETFGTPVRQTTPMGEPPITSWVFDNFTVYFEYDYVIHTVLHDAESKPIN